MAKIYCKSSYLLRKDTMENWGNKNPVLRKGEQGLETDTGIIKIGDGTTEYNSLTDDNIYFPISRINKSVAEAVTEAKGYVDTQIGDINTALDSKADISYVDTRIGDIDTALDSIIALQNSYIGGNS